MFKSLRKLIKFKGCLTLDVFFKPSPLPSFSLLSEGLSVTQQASPSATC